MAPEDRTPRAVTSPRGSISLELRDPPVRAAPGTEKPWAEGAPHPTPPREKKPDLTWRSLEATYKITVNALGLTRGTFWNMPWDVARNTPSRVPGRELHQEVSHQKLMCCCQEGLREATGAPTRLSRALHHAAVTCPSPRGCHVPFTAARHWRHRSLEGPRPQATPRTPGPASPCTASGALYRPPSVFTAAETKQRNQNHLHRSGQKGDFGDEREEINTGTLLFEQKRGKAM